MSPRIARTQSAIERAYEKSLDRTDPGDRIAGGAEDDVLLLTEVVAEDGSVVSLAEDALGAADAPEAAPPAFDVAAWYSARAIEDSEMAAAVALAMDADAEMAKPDRGATEPAAKHRHHAAEPEPEPEPEKPAVLPEPVPLGRPMGSPNPTPSVPAHRRSHPSPAIAGRDAALSREAAAACRGAFAALREFVAEPAPSMARAATAGRALTVEDVVREELRPMLQEWLDGNLPNIVHRTVRLEIERLSEDESGPDSR